MSDPALAVDGLEVRYGAVPAVRELTLAVRTGEVVGLIGPNGAGKSTTLLAIMGVVPWYRGDVRVAGRSLRGLRTEDIVRSGVALVPEGRDIFGDLTVEENLRLGLVGRRASNGNRRPLASVYELFPILEEFRRRRAGDLSGGQQQQLAIARALLAEPDVLLLDEPSLGLAPTLVEAVFRTLDEIRRSGVSVLLVEQRAQVTIGFADRTYVMSNGKITLTLRPPDAEDTERVVAAYFAA